MQAFNPRGAAIDMPAGPSEVMVVADGSGNSDFIAADLLAQAEHGPDSQVILVSFSPGLTRAVRERVLTRMEGLSHLATIKQALCESLWFDVATKEEALEIVDTYAPEHLILQLRQAKIFSDQVRNAGSIFLGNFTPEVLGDYVSGTNHVLPTNGAARAYSGLGVESFMKSITVQEVNPLGFRSVGPIARDFARIEGLTAHALAVELRESYLYVKERAKRQQRAGGILL